MDERGLSLSHTTIMRWVHKAGPLLDKMVRPYLKIRSGSWRLDETYIKVKGKWMYLYRAVDKHGNTIDFYFSRTRSGKAAKRFLTKAVCQQNTDDQPLYAMNFDKNSAYTDAFREIRKEDRISDSVEFRQVKYLNNVVEQDHRFIKKKMKINLGFKSFKTAYDTIKGLEAMNMIRKNQLFNILKNSPILQMNFTNRQFGLAGSYI